MVDVSVVLPAFNEASIVSASLRRLTEFLSTPGAGPWTSWEILLVDDGSLDGTAEVARRACPDPDRLRIIGHAANQGKGAAVRSGLLSAAGEIAIVTDVDLSYGLADMALMARALMPAPAGGGYDMVTGDRRHPDARLDLALSALGHVMRRQMISAAFNLAARLAYGFAWRDTQCGLKGFRRDAGRRIASRLTSAGFLADIEMFLIAGELGLKVTSIPVHLTYLSANSTVDVVRSLPRVARDAWAIKRRQVRGDYAERGGGQAT